jgi:hypothetical protein
MRCGGAGDEIAGVKLWWYGISGCGSLHGGGERIVVDDICIKGERGDVVLRGKSCSLVT